jgi:hypothetical protein
VSKEVKELLELLRSKKLVVEIRLEEKITGGGSYIPVDKELTPIGPEDVGEMTGIPEVARTTPRDKEQFVDSVIENWNKFANWANSDGGFTGRVAKVRPSNKTIRRKVAARFKDPAWQLGYWKPMLAKLETLRGHYKGDNDTGWRINLKFLVRNDGQAEELLAGEWSEAAPKSTEVTQADIAEGLAALDKMEKETPW